MFIIHLLYFISLNRLPVETQRIYNPFSKPMDFQSIVVQLVFLKEIRLFLRKNFMMLYTDR